jgi:hypothetical protein
VCERERDRKERERQTAPWVHPRARCNGVADENRLFFPQSQSQLPEVCVTCMCSFFKIQTHLGSVPGSWHALVPRACWGGRKLSPTGWWHSTGAGCFPGATPTVVLKLWLDAGITWTFLNYLGPSLMLEWLESMVWQGLGVQAS